jgi:hypothetical protein
MTTDQHQTAQTHYTVWRFTFVGGEHVVSVRASEQTDMADQNKSQKVLWRGLALSKQQALEIAKGRARR